MLKKGYTCYNRFMEKKDTIGYQTLFSIVAIVIASFTSYYGTQAANAKVISELSTRVTVVETNYTHLLKGMDTLLERTEPK